MTKTELIQGLSQRTNLNLKESKEAVDAFLDSIMEGLAKKGKVALRRFGTFRVSERGGRMARNPKTGTLTKIGPRRSPRFKAGKDLKEIVNRGNL